MTFAAIFSLIVGILMISVWAFLLATRQVTGLKTEPVEITFHLVAEFLTVLTLVIGGIAFLAKSLLGYPLVLLALGKLLYTLINSPGYYAQKREWPMVVLFAVLLVLDLVSIVLMFTSLFDLIVIG